MARATGAGVRSVATAGSAADHAKETSAIKALERRGFTQEFIATGDHLRLRGTDRRFAPEDVRIRNYFRFEGTSDPDDMSVVYALESDDGTRGILVDAFGSYADPQVGALLDRMRLDVGSSSPWLPARWIALLIAGFGVGVLTVLALRIRNMRGDLGGLSERRAQVRPAARPGWRRRDRRGARA